MFDEFDIRVKFEERSRTSKLVRFEGAALNCGKSSAIRLVAFEVD